MGKQRRKYEPEFKSEAVRLVRHQGRSVADVARSLGIHVNTLHTWVKELPREGSTKPRRSHRNAESEAVRQLERELRRVTEGRDILKKAVVDSTDRRNIIRSILRSGGVADGSTGAPGIVRVREGGALGTMEERPVV
ncbi:MAG TPA: transposase [Candidatus Krumholzibacteria bacterium]